MLRAAWLALAEAGNTPASRAGAVERVGKRVGCDLGRAVVTAELVMRKRGWAETGDRRIGVRSEDVFGECP